MPVITGVTAPVHTLTGRLTNKPNHCQSIRGLAIGQLTDLLNFENF